MSLAIPRFDNAADALQRRPVSGRVLVRIVSQITASGVRGGGNGGLSLGQEGVVGEVRRNGRALAAFDATPFEFEWDTTRETDGRVLLSLFLVNINTDAQMQTDQRTVTVQNDAPNVSTRSGGSPPARLPVQTLMPRLSVSRHPFDAPTTALLRLPDGRIAQGLADGGVALSRPDGSHALVVRLPARTNGVRAMCAAANGGVLWWTSESGGTLLFRFAERDQTLRAYDAAWPNAPHLTRFFVNGREVVRSWVERLTPATDGVTLVGGQIALRVRTSDGETASAPVPPTVPLIEGAAYRQNDFAARIVASTRRGFWQTGGYNGLLFEAGGRQTAYLPWNVSGSRAGAARALLADENGVWVAGANGVHRIRPGASPGPDGFGGYVRVPLGPETVVPRTSWQERVAQAAQEWQGVPYLWGGNDKFGVDCSGFVGAVMRSVGVSLPRTTAAMARMHEGRRVRDELRLGDLLVYPGHCALYLGDGQTAETVGGRVGRSTIWNRSTVIVRRFT